MGAKKSSTTVQTAAANTFNLLKEWQSSRENEKDYLKQAKDVAKKSRLQAADINREADKKRGDAIGQVGASGVKVSSFDDALLSEDLEAARKAYEVENEARVQAAALRRQARSERRKRYGSVASYSVGLLGGLSGTGV